jgi:hypothetical protein
MMGTVPDTGGRDYRHHLVLDHGRAPSSSEQRNSSSLRFARRASICVHVTVQAATAAQLLVRVRPLSRR